MEHDFAERRDNFLHFFMIFDNFPCLSSLSSAYKVRVTAHIGDLTADMRRGRDSPHKGCNS